ncbi:hypothetical protein [Acidovorax sp. MR-S7]|uniref:hypothetical protein n=1 Tax=Acidovorax sp. MR-S7 TaxID=1268622 RepID=UPI000375E45A|nr:hypothetical protein [Acidovorax sp. MR-S7]GAD22438.1 hypothetical protein AVS7_02198 [Acidovorax sp. MR-S7]
MTGGVLVYDSVTRMDPAVRGRAVIAASHGGVYAVHLALSEGVGGLVVSDGGVGLARAGIAGLDFAQALGVPCAAIDHRSARIGDGADCAARGVIAFANAQAERLGVRAGMPALQAAQCLAAAPLRAVDPGPLPAEARTVLPPQAGRRPIVLIDSVSLAAPEDRDAVVLTGSHGGLQGGRPESAIKVDVFAALYNDAGIGCDGAGVSRLPALDARGIAGATVAAGSARIGDARSAWETGVISRVNQTARALGAREGQSARAWAEGMAAAAGRP